jgi:hypothetical protein
MQKNTRIDFTGQEIYVGSKHKDFVHKPALG